MTPIKKQTPPPPGIVKLAASHPGPFLLLIYLDGIPYAEVQAKTDKAFKAAYEDWRRTNLAQLNPTKVNVRFYARTPKGLNEFKP
jgi:hypothetical protein